MGPRGPGRAAQERAGRAGGERHGGLVGLAWLGGGSSRREATRGGTGRDGRGEEEEEASNRKKKDLVWCRSRSAGRPDEIRGGLEHFRVGLTGPQ